MLAEAGSVIKIAKEQGWLDKLVDCFKKKHKVLVLGSSGVGKSNLIQSLTKELPEAIHYSTRTSGTPTSQIKISKVLFHFIDTPGQDSHRAYRMKSYREHLNSLDLVVNVVCHGYHEYAQGKAKAITTDGKIDPDYVIANRIREIDAVNEWSEILGDSSKYRLLTVVTKADIWWDQHEEVLKHYQSGEYFEKLGAAQRLDPCVTYHSSVLHKLYGVGSLSGQFDEEDRVRSRANLLKTIVEMIGEGGLNG